MKLIVGLGNPGTKYQGTRHNIGFAVADELARRANVVFASARADALVAQVRRPGGPGGNDEAVLIAKPLTFMNASGQAAGELLRYFKIEPSALLVIVDEVQLPLGKLRARRSGSAGGHNGLKSLIEHVGPEFARLRVGVGRGADGSDGGPRRDLADHVLAPFEPGERAEVERMTNRAADAAEIFIASGIGAVMNQFNSGDLAVTE